MRELCLKKAVPNTEQKDFVVFMAAAFSAFKKQGFVSTFWMSRKKDFTDPAKVTDDQEEQPRLVLGSSLCLDVCPPATSFCFFRGRQVLGRGDVDLGLGVPQPTSRGVGEHTGRAGFQSCDVSLCRRASDGPFIPQDFCSLL